MTTPINNSSNCGSTREAQIQKLASNNETTERAKASEQIQNFFQQVAGNTNGDKELTRNELMGLMQSGVLGGAIGSIGADVLANEIKGLNIKEFDLSNLKSEADVQTVNTSIWDYLHSLLTPIFEANPQLFGGKVETATKEAVVDTGAEDVSVDNSAYEDFRESKPES